MNTLKNSIIILLLVLILAFTAIMVFPVDSFVAKRASAIKGYEVNTDFDDGDYRDYYNNLNENEQLAYSLIYAQIFDFPESILVPDMTNKEVENVFKALSYDNPELFFLGNKCNFTSIGSFNYFMPHYVLSEPQYIEMAKELKEKVKTVLSSVDESATDYEKELYVHDYVTRNCEYADGGSPMVYTIYGSLVDGKANCEGYSRAMQYLLEEVGIKNHLVTGFAINAQGENEGHMWNVVQIDEKKFNLDATWNDYFIGNSVSSPDNAPSHAYFNLSSDKMRATHTIDDETLWSDCVFDSHNYFVLNSLLFDKCDITTESVVRREIADSLMMGDCSLEIAFSNEAAYKGALVYFIDQNRLYTILRAVNEVVPSASRVDSKQVQYTNDDDKRIIRFFFMR